MPFEFQNKTGLKISSERKSTLIFARIIMASLLQFSDVIKIQRYRYISIKILVKYRPNLTEPRPLLNIIKIYVCIYLMKNNIAIA